MKFKKLTSLMLVTAVTASMLAGCGGGSNEVSSTNSTGDNSSASAGGGKTDAVESSGNENQEITEFSYFITMPGKEINDDNEIAQIIAEKTGVKVKETWLTGQTAAEATGTLVAGGEYPDFIDSDDMSVLVDAGALLPLDEYIDQ